MIGEEWSIVKWSAISIIWKKKVIEEKMTDYDYSVGDEMVQGELKRQEDHFRDWVTKDGSSEYPAVTGRYCLYVSLACPLGVSHDYWAWRAWSA